MAEYSFNLLSFGREEPWENLMVLLAFFFSVWYNEEKGR